jgi:membrane-associated phospholipid phosphatase
VSKSRIHRMSRSRVIEGERAREAGRAAADLGRAWGASALEAARRTVAGGAWLRGRLASVGGGLRELIIMGIAYGLYSLVRGVWGGTLAEGRDNARSLVHLEKSLNIFIEPNAQNFFMQHHLGMPFWNGLYVVSQVVALPLTLFLVYRYRRQSYAFVRNMAAISWSAGLVCYALFPVAPPRLLASGFTDTVSSQTFFNLDSSFIRAFYNPVAAMPSLHVGMAPVVAWALIALTPWWWSRALGVAYPLLIAVSIVVTGNHYVLDIAGGLAVVIPAVLIAAWIVKAPRRPPAPAAADGPAEDIRPVAGGPGTAYPR